MILDKYNIFWSEYIHNPTNKQRYPGRKQCKVVVVRRKKDAIRLAKLVILHMFGEKKEKAEKYIGETNE